MPALTTVREIFLNRRGQLGERCRPAAHTWASQHLDVVLTRSEQPLQRDPRPRARPCYRAFAEKVAEPLHSAACVLIVPLTVRPENLPLTTCTIAGGPGPAMNRSVIVARNVPEPEICAGLVVCTCSALVVLQ
jgi:hypothetical protein